MDKQLDNTIHIDINRLVEADWNVNVTPPEIMARLEYSLKKFGQLENLLVREIEKNGEKVYEILSGNHRSRLMKKLGFEKAMCLVVDLSDTEARLVAQAMNRLGGEDDINKKAQLYSFLIDKGVEKREIISLLPETENRIDALLKLRDMKMSEMFDNLKEESNSVQMTISFTNEQWQIVNTALERFKEVEQVDYKNFKSKFFEYMSAQYISEVGFDEGN